MPDLVYFTGIFIPETRRYVKVVPGLVPGSGYGGVRIAVVFC